MDERKRKVLRAVVALYGLDGEPVDVYKRQLL